MSTNWLSSLTSGLKKKLTPNPQGGLSDIDAYCISCKERRLFGADAHITVSDTGRKAARGSCQVCGTGMVRLMGRDD